MADWRGRPGGTRSTGAPCPARSRARCAAAGGCASKRPVGEDSEMSPDETVERIGFLGLGIMGSRMAANVLRADFPLSVWTHTPGKAERWASEHGAKAATTPAELARESDIVVSMLVDGPQVAEVLLGEEGVIAEARPGMLCVDMSTIAPGETRTIGAGLGERGVGMLDAPVTGSSPRAADGTLTIMVGGEPEDFVRARPLLKAMGNLIVHVGELGQGEVVKLINNSLAAANASALAEGLVMASATGVDLDAFLQVAAAGSAGSAQLELKAGAMGERDYT